MKKLEIDKIPTYNYVMTMGILKSKSIDNYSYATSFQKNDLNTRLMLKMIDLYYFECKRL